jgi:hypothetical protein
LQLIAFKENRYQFIMNQALMQADLAKLPLWWGDAAKDGYTVEQWCKRVDKAAVSADWDAGNTI